MDRQCTPDVFITTLTPAWTAHCQDAHAQRLCPLQRASEAGSGHSCTLWVAESTERVADCSVN